MSSAVTAHKKYCLATHFPYVESCQPVKTEAFSLLTDDCVVTEAMTGALTECLE